LAILLTTTLVATLGAQAPAFAATPGYDLHRIPSVPVTKIASKATAAPATTTPPAVPVVWPAAGMTDLDLTVPNQTTAKTAATGTAAAAVVTVERSGAVTGPGLRSAAADPTRVRLEMLGQDKVTAGGRQRLLFNLSRADGDASAARVRVRVNYSGFAGAYGGDWANRLRIVALTDCAAANLDTCAGTPVETANDPRTATASADVLLPTATTAAVASSMSASQRSVGVATLALDAAPKGDAGDYTASALTATATWKAGGSTGDFAWSYPIGLPPVPSHAPAPQVALAYSSASVDGLSAATNNQPSWIGQGFQYTSGSVQRSYRSCSEDTGSGANNGTDVGDLCWATDNALLTLNGSATELVKNGTNDEWHLRNDDGSKVEHLTGAVNGANNGEYWKVTTTIGTQYWFGRNRLPGWSADKEETQSTWTEPVAGNQPNEPCHQSTFAASFCTQAYAWNLDYVVDPHGNSISYWYQPETGYYARNNVTATPVSYTRAGTLKRIDYGTTVSDPNTGVDSEYTGSAPARVNFGTTDRCLSDCGNHDKAHWPDVPWDQECTAGTSCQIISPTFWSKVRLTSIKTQVWGGAAYRDVDSWALRQSFPNPNDGTQAGLWLDGVTHTGLVDGSLATPEVTFEGYQLPNRVDTDGAKPLMNWRRMWKIHNEYGGVISVTYSDPDCVAGSRMPSATALESNALRCYPVYWTPGGPSTLRLEYFNKYVVTMVRQSDNIGDAPPIDTTYEYSNLAQGTALWHYTDEDGLSPENRRTWASWRGYEKVVTRVGTGADQTTVEDRFFRGMDGDHLPSGTRSVSIADDEGNTWPDSDAFAGQGREHIVYNGAAVVSTSVNDLWQSDPTSTRTINGVATYARRTGTVAVSSRTVLDADRGSRRTKASTSFDAYGMAATVEDQGDLAVTGDEQCTRTFYDSRNTTKWIVGLVSRTQVTAGLCAHTPASEADIISDSRSSFDGNGYGAPASKGDVTNVEVASAWTPSQTTWVSTGKTTYDGYGRTTDSWDALNHHTGTAYSISADGRTMHTVTTNALQYQVSSDTDLAWGTEVSSVDLAGKRTDIAHDPLGRVTQVWLPTRSKAGNQSANTVFTYLLRNDGSSATTTAHLNAAGVYTTTYTLYDGLGRTRQTQAPSASASGGRILSDTIYNSAGAVSLAYANYYNSGAPGVDIVKPLQTDVPTQTATIYDQAGRSIASVFQPKGVELWRTTTTYGGDHTDNTPPSGGIAYTAVTDARGQVVQRLQYQGGVADYHNSGLVATAVKTNYYFTVRNQLERVVDGSGNEWKYGYDLRGRRTSVKNPDSTRDATSAYDDAGNLTTTTDPLQHTLVRTYDVLNRQIGLYDDSTSGPLRATWTYDTIAKGHPTSQTRYVGQSAYVAAVTGYDNAYNVTGNSVTIPSVEGAELAKTYTFKASFKIDKSPDTLTYPATTDLPTETLFYGYDNVLGLPKKLTTLYGSTSSTYITDTAYDELGRKVGYTRSTAATGAPTVKSSYTFDDLTGRLNRSHTVRSAQSPTDVTDVHFAYTNVGTIRSIADTPAGGQADVQCFTQDDLQRTTEAWTPASGDCSAAPSPSLGGPAPYWQSWTYDSSNNRLSQVDHVTSAGETTSRSTYPAAGAAWPHAPSTVTTTDNNGTRESSYTYDAAGHTLTRPGQSLAWDPEDHLASVTAGTAVSSYVYGVDGQRLVTHDPGATTVYLPGMELRLDKATHQVKTTRYYGDDAVRTSAGLTWLVPDEHGTATVVINASTQQATYRRMTPFGTARGATPASWPDAHGFVGGVLDPTGLTHLGAREYDPTAGRFISGDQVLHVDQAQTLNPYAYSNNNPSSFSDPSGLSWLSGLKKAAESAINGTTLAGIGIMVLGALMDAGGIALTFTVIGAPLGAMIVVGGTEVMMAGAAVAAAGVVQGCAQNAKDNFNTGEGAGEEPPPPKGDAELKFGRQEGSWDEAAKLENKANAIKKERQKKADGTAGTFDSGTVSVVRVFDRVTGEYQEMATFEGGDPLPSKMGTLNADGTYTMNNGMKWVRGTNGRHAEQNAMDTVKKMNADNAAKGGSANRYQITEGAASRRICDTNCAPDLEDSHLEYGPGPKTYVGDRTPFYQFVFRWQWARD
jgi:RHS repeat-associated protein